MDDERDRVNDSAMDMTPQQVKDLMNKVKKRLGPSVKQKAEQKQHTCCGHNYQHEPYTFTPQQPPQEKLVLTKDKSLCFDCKLLNKL
jgi:hypothetical protein